MDKIDFKKSQPELYRPSAKEASLVDVPAMKFFTVEGKGNPNTAPSFQVAMEALYGLSYTLKFMFKDIRPAGYFDYVIPPMEGLWWMDSGAKFTADNKDDWQWQVLIRQPDYCTDELVEQGRTEMARKKPGVSLNTLRFATISEGTAMQVLHIGSYDAEEESIAKIMAAIGEQGYRVNGKHHEIYLSDPRRTAPEKLKTVIRYPIARV